MKSTTTSRVLSIFSTHVLRYKGLLSVVVSGASIAIFFDMMQPFLLKNLFNLFSDSSTTITACMQIIILIVLCKIGAWTCLQARAFATNRLQPKVMLDLEVRALSKLFLHSYQFFSDHFSGSLVRRVSRLGRAFERIADEVTFTYIPVTLILTLSLIGFAIQYPLFALFFLIWVIIIIGFNLWASGWAYNIDVERAKIDSELGGTISDALSNAVTIKLFASQSRELETYASVGRRYIKAQTRSWDRHQIISAIQFIMMIALEALLMGYGVILWKAGMLSLGDLAFIQATLTIVYGKLWELSRSFRHMYDAIADAKEMVEIIDQQLEIKTKKTAKPLIITRGSIKFQNVEFAFGKNSVLKDFSLSIKSKEKIALVGPSGAGKSTVTKLLFRFFEPQSGTITIDGNAINSVTEDSLRTTIAYVPQDPILFHRTLLDNIRYGKPDATIEAVIIAAKQAHCHEFISNLKDGYETFVGERGIKLSGGERQRVAIARAILTEAPILILDEATSALDSESELLIQDALHTLMQNKTVIVIAHRLSTVKEMDRIIVIEHGEISAQGSHEQLLREDGMYRRLWNLQAGGFREVYDDIS